MAEQALKRGEVSQFGAWRKAMQEQISVEETRLKRLLCESAPKPFGVILLNDMVIADIVKYLSAYRKYHATDMNQIFSCRSLAEFRKALNNLRRAWKGIVKITCVEENGSDRLLVTFTAIESKSIGRKK